MRRLHLLMTWLVFVLLAVLPGGFPAAAQDSPEDVVSAFLDAWDAENYEAMYDLIYVNRVNGEPEYPLQVFTNRYTQVDDTISIDGVDYTINDVRMQGQSAEVTYDVTLESPAFGQIEDTGRMMRLVNRDGRWRVAWSTMDIFDGLVFTEGGDNPLTVQAEATTRARIYDRNGNVLAEDGRTTIGLNGARARMDTEQECLRLLADLTREPLVDLQQRFSNYIPETIFFLAELPQQVYQDNLSRLQAECGISEGFSSLPHRSYTGGSAMVHPLGYVSQVSDAEEEARYGRGQMVGRDGIEQAFNDELAGSPERSLRLVDPATGTTVRELASIEGEAPMPVSVTLDRDLQLIVADALAQAFNYAAPNWGAEGVSTGGAAVVLDVNNGDILAMASYPMFNPSLFNPNTATPNRGEFLSAVTGSERRPLLNRVIEEQYPPGSVFKIVTLAAALNEGVVSPGDQFDCGLYWDGSEYGDTVGERSDWRVTVEDFGPAGVLTPAQALMASCNPWFWEHGAKLYQNVGASTLVDYADRMGMLDAFGIAGTTQEAAGSFPVPSSATEAINVSVGQQDVAVPPLQIATMVASVANGGTVYRPQLVEQVGGQDGTSVQRTVEPEVLNTLDFNEGVLETVQEGMQGVTSVEDLGTAYGRFVSSNSELSYTEVTAPYSVAGKTGTAETARYPNAWFVAYAPTDEPEIAVVVMVEQSLEGSQVAAPIVRRILDDYFNAERASYPGWWNQGPYEPLDTPEDAGLG